jgi:hypothetical protein
MKWTQTKEQYLSIDELINVTGELAKHAISEGTKAVTKLSCSGKGGRLSMKSGLIFPGKYHSLENINTH